MTYKSMRRQWVKLWVNEWLDGTSRFELTPQQRLMWVDLLALAGRSRFPGEIYAGVSAGGKKIGYPLAYLAGVLQMEETAVHSALTVLAHHEHIVLTEHAHEQYVITVRNWNKYQSEYLRQRTYRKVTTENTERLPVEGEGEGEGDVDGEKTFCSWWCVYPRKEGKKRARDTWKKLSTSDRQKALESLSTYRETESWNRDGGKYIPHASTFLAQRRWEDEPIVVGPENNEGTSRTGKAHLSADDKEYYKKLGIL